MDLERLKTLIALADGGSMAAAARSLGTGQNTVHKRISELEAEVGVPLVERAGRRLVLTASGAVLVRGGRELLARSRALVARVWAAWQEVNLASGDAARMVDHGNPGYPDEYRGPLFNFSEVQASDTFDYKALGYEYDTLPTPQ